MHISLKERGNWGVKSMKCIFIWYSINCIFYRPWNPKAWYIRVSRDVVFVEEDFDGRTSILQYVERRPESNETVPSSTIEDNTDDQDAVVDNHDAIKDNVGNREIPHRSPFTVHRSPFTVHRSPFIVHRSPFTVQQGLEGHLNEVVISLMETGGNLMKHYIAVQIRF